MKHSTPVHRRRDQRSGFALILALVLMSLVFLLVITLVTFVGTELRLSELRKQKVLADVNARMGLMVAIGELQKHAGLDTRITGTAGLLDYDPTQREIATTLEYEDVANPYWTGVWKRQAAAPLTPKNLESYSLGPPKVDKNGNLLEPPPDLMYDSSFDEHPANEVAWLVSGNEGRNLGGKRRHDWLHDEDETDVEYRNRIHEDLDGDGHPDYFHPAFDDVPTPLEDNSSSVWLVQNSVLDPRNLDPKLYGKVKVMKTRMTLDPSKMVVSSSSSNSSPGSSPPSTYGKQRPVGAYAYWVGDEGVKAKATVISPHKDADISSDYQRAESNLLVSPGPNLGAALDLEIDPAHDDAREKVINPSDLKHILTTGGGGSTGASTAKEQLMGNFHSITTESMGVLADVFRGGLRRDLTGYFGSPDDQWDGDNSTPENELNLIPFFRDRVHYLKEFAPGKDKANKWRYGDDAPINEKDGFLAGPMWSVLRGYYNLHKHFSGSDPHAMIVPPKAPDRYPQRVGDHYVSFESRPRNKNGTVSNHMQPYIRNKAGYEYGPNSFNYQDQREEPTNHPIGPVLVELQHRQILYTAKSGGGYVLRMGILPTFSLWNPYNVKLSPASYQMEYMVKGCTIAAYNTKEREIFYKWQIHSQRRAPLVTDPRLVTVRGRNRVIDKNRNYYNFWGLDHYNWGDAHTGEPYMDLNLNSRYDAGEPFEDKNKNGHHDPSHGGNDEWWWVQNRMWHANMQNYFGNADDLNGSDWTAVGPGGRNLQAGPKALSDTFHDFRARNDRGTFPAFMPYVADGKVRHFRPYQVDPHARSRDTDMPPLRLRTVPTSFEPGEKLIFCITPGPTRYQPGEIITMVNHHGRTEKHHVYFEGDASQFFIRGNDPITIRHLMHGSNGFNRGSKEFNHEMVLQNPNLLLKGTVLYLMDGSVRRPIQKINKEFGNHHRIWRKDYRRAIDLSDEAQLPLKGRIITGEGLGYRIRRRLSTNSMRIVFHEFNPRALVDSFQDGSGDLWQVQSFERRGIHRDPFRDNRQHIEFYSRYKFDGNSTQRWVMKQPGFYQSASRWNAAPNGTKAFNPDVENSGGRWYGHLGHSHDMSDSSDPLVTTPRLALFDVPRQPMLSIAQFQHANLNWYSHSPAYVVGNSYATGQVGRYKKWGRVSRIIWQPEFPEHPKDYLDRQKDPIGSLFNHVVGHRSGWWWDTKNYDTGMGVLRDANSEVEHQNLTIDQSVYANEALFDSFYFSSVPTEETGTTFSQEEIDDNEPLPNGRLAFYREKGQSPELSDLQDPQTANSNLLVNGMFNLNSTSVEAWMAQLASLSGQQAKMLDLQDQHMLSGSAGSSQTVKFDSDKFPFLRHSTPLGEEIPPASQGVDANRDYWTGYVVLDRNQLRLLAEKMVGEVKIRGPFLSLADFINRRITTPPGIPGSTTSFHDLRAMKAKTWPEETAESETGFRGTIQAAIANAGFNKATFSKTKKRDINHDNMGGATSFNFPTSIFGEQVANRGEWIGNPFWGRGIWMYENKRTYFDWRDTSLRNRRIEKLRTVYKDAYDFGEAPDNLQGIENSVTAAMMPGWLTQGDVLTPLAPVISARSDTFLIRAYGEPDVDTGAKRYCEAVVQRIPDYVINERSASYEQGDYEPVAGDPAHHRPLEPFDDGPPHGIFDGVWTSGEPWLDLNQNAPYSHQLQRAQGPEVEEPDLPGGKGVGKFSAGLRSDLELKNFTNRRFGRKYRILKFRWLTEEEV